MVKKDQNLLWGMQSVNNRISASFTVMPSERALNILLTITGKKETEVSVLKIP